MLSGLAGSWRYRSFVLSSIAGELRSRINRSRLGAIWLVVPPLAQVAIFSLILSQVMAARLPGVEGVFAYSIYLMAGMLAWTLFTEVLSRSLTIFIDNAGILKKISFPKMTLPLIVYGVAAINSAILTAAVLVGFVLMGHWPWPTVLWLPVLALLCSTLALSLGLILGVLNVFVRDVGQITAIVLQVGFWFTPVVYIPEIVPESVRWLLKFNPMYWIVTAYHDALVYGRMPNLVSLTAIAFLIALLSGLALLVYRRASAEMVDVL
jgi:lipopolysaccharide transport system permease protein